MWLVRFMRSVAGRVLRVVVGLSLIGYGSQQASLMGLVLMMIGIVPAVTGAAGICLIEEVIRSREVSRLPPAHPHEHRA
jgi:hypothetical protein